MQPRMCPSEKLQDPVKQENPCQRSLGPQVHYRCGDRSAVCLVTGVAAPAVVSVIQRHGGIELGCVVAIHARESERCCKEPGALGSKIELARIGAADDSGQTLEWFGSQTERVEH